MSAWLVKDWSWFLHEVSTTCLLACLLACFSFNSCEKVSKYFAFILTYCLYPNLRYSHEWKHNYKWNKSHKMNLNTCFFGSHITKLMYEIKSHKVTVGSHFFWITWYSAYVWNKSHKMNLNTCFWITHYTADVWNKMLKWTYSVT